MNNDNNGISSVSFQNKGDTEYKFQPDKCFKYVFANITDETRIKILNYLFNVNLCCDTKLIRPNVEFSEYNPVKNEFELRRLDTIYLDLNTGIKYHIEFQSSKDDNMGLRVFLYGLYSSMEDIVDNTLVFPKSHIIYTKALDKNMRVGTDEIKLLIDKVRINDNIYENYTISVVTDYTDLLGFNLEELINNDLFMLSFAYFYRYLKYKYKLNTDEKVKIFYNEFNDYINSIYTLDLPSSDKEILLDIILSIYNDIKNIINVSENISEEVKIMYQEEYVPEFTKIRRQIREEGREEGILNSTLEVIRNGLSMGLDVDKLARLTSLTAEDVQYLIDSNINPQHV